MDLSINNINTKKNINFKGMTGTFNTNSEPVFRFDPPKVEKDKCARLVIVPLAIDETTGDFKKPTKADKRIVINFDNNMPVEVKQSIIMKHAKNGFGYNYEITDNDGKHIRYAYDAFETMSTGENNPLITVIRYNKKKDPIIYNPKYDMIHCFKDSCAVKKTNPKGETKVVKSSVSDFSRNHFNKLGGSLEDILQMVTEENSELEPYGFIMTTPDIGADKVSSHGYWPANHYQCSSLDTFKKFNFELFKKGKSYVADGAFTSQGIQSPLVQHVLKWGEKSPFYHWLKIDGRPTLGILPDFNSGDEENPFKHFGVRLVNPKGNDYNPNKPTYIQFYDDRLLKENEIKDGQPHFSYTKKPDDIYEITTHQDSIQPYAFEIDPNGPKAKAFGNERFLKLSKLQEDGKLQDFLTFENFTIGEKNKAAGVTLWDGSVDIIKMNLSNPIANDANRQGFFDARNYIFGVSDYWTETVQSHLILETAKIAKSDELEKIAKANGIETTAQEGKKSWFDKIKASVTKGEFASRILEQDKSYKQTAEIIKNFPLQSLETSEELSAIFVQPEFKKQLFDNDILKNLEGQFNSIIDTISKDKGDDYKAYIKKVYGNDILRYIFVSAISPNAVENNEINLKKLGEVTLKSIDKGKSASPEEEVKAVVNRIKEGLKNVKTKSFTEKLAEETRNITLDNFKLAEAIVLQSKAGLNWRFDAAKDIGDLDAIKAGKKTFNQIFEADSKTPGVEEFWTEFVSRARRHNPATYIINELTSLGDFVEWEPWKDKTSRENFNPKLAKNIEKLTLEEQKNYDNSIITQQQKFFLSNTNSTTTSEYSKGFNSFSEFAGVNPEKKASAKSAGNLTNIKNIMTQLMATNQPVSALHSHMFVSNHDKPSVLHTMPLDMEAFLEDDIYKAIELLKESNEKTVKEILEKIDPNTYDYSKISPKALTVAVPMFDAIEEIYENDKNTKNNLINKLIDRILGKNDKGKQSFKHSQAFGVRPYEVTIPDLLKRSGITGEALEDSTLKLHYKMMKNSMTYFERLWQVMNACVGIPTLYNGTEFAQTGYETPSKNEYLGIRNEVLHGLKDKEGYEEYYDKIRTTSKLSQAKELSALRSGTPVLLDIIPSEKIDKPSFTAPKELNEGKLKYFAEKIAERLMHQKGYEELNAEAIEEKIKKIIKDYPQEEACKYFGISTNDGNPEALVKTEFASSIAKAVKTQIEYNNKTRNITQIWPIFRKNAEGSEVLSIVTNLGMPRGQASFASNAEEKIKYTVKDGIDLKQGEKIYEGLEGSTFKRFGDDATEYIVKGGKLWQKAGCDNIAITLTDTVTHFYKALF